MESMFTILLLVAYVAFGGVRYFVFRAQLVLDESWLGKTRREKRVGIKPS
jgi:hypothetical protein